MTNKNPNNMGGPSFHPDLEADLEKQKAPRDRASAKIDRKNDGAILEEDQVPPL